MVVAAIGGAAASLLLVVGFPVVHGMAALWRGSFGSWYAFTSATLVRAVPLLLTGCAVALAFRGGVLQHRRRGAVARRCSIGSVRCAGGPAAEMSASLWIAAALVAGAVGGALLAAVAAYLRLRFGVLEVISTIMLNFVALHVVSYLVRDRCRSRLTCTRRVQQSMWHSASHKFQEQEGCTSALSRTRARRRRRMDASVYRRWLPSPGHR